MAEPTVDHIETGRSERRPSERGSPRPWPERRARTSEAKQAMDELRKTEAFNRVVLESSSDWINVLDLEGRILYMNPGGVRSLNIRNQAKHGGSPWMNFWKGNDRVAAQSAL